MPDLNGQVSALVHWTELKTCYAATVFSFDTKKLMRQF